MVKDINFYLVFCILFFIFIFYMFPFNTGAKGIQLISIFESYEYDHSPMVRRMIIPNDNVPKIFMGLFDSCYNQSSNSDIISFLCQRINDCINPNTIYIDKHSFSLTETSILN